MLWNHTNTTIQTAVLVFADPGLDSWLLGDTGTTSANFHRGTGGGILYTGYIAAGLVSGQTFLNGRAVDPQRTFLVKEPAVLTFALTSNRFARASAFACDRWVADKTFRTGDQKLCEVVLYDRYLNRDERRAVEAWLMRKWLPVEPAGYEATDGREIAGEIRAVPATGDSAAIDVSAGKVTVGALSGTGALLKTGGGTLAVAGFADFAGPLQLNEGTVEVQARVLPEPFPLPGGVVFHLDASLSGSVLCEADGISVTNLLDASAGPRSARPPVGYPRPQRVTGALNGLPVIDFGASGTGCCLLWDAPVKTVRSVFWVIGSQAGGGMPLGTKESGDGTDFLRADVMKAGVWNGGSSKTLNGATRIDGRLVNGALEGFSGGYQVMSLITAEDATASAFAADRFVGADAARMARTGGQRLGEVVVFNRVLSDLERRDVEAYLSRKWFGQLPQGYAGAAVEVAKVVSGGGELRAQDSETTVTIRSLLGTEDVIKTGGHTLSLYQAHDFAGRLVVSNGVLALSGIPISPDIPQAGMLMHMDAAATNSFMLAAENGTNFITRWNSLSGPRYAAHDGQSRRPYLLDSELNGRPVVEFGPYYDQSADRYNGAYLDWDQEVNTIKTVFLVLGSQAGGNFLMTSREANTAHFHRAYDAYGKVSVNAALLATGRTEVPACLMSSGAYTSADGVRINPFATTPSGGYQVFCFQTDDTAAVTAGTFARDRTYRFGGQRLAEVILYDRVLTAEERDQVEAYLQDKWFGRAYGAYVRDVPLDDVIVGPDGVLDLTGETRSVAVLSGSGTVSNGTVRVTDILDVGAGAGDCAVMAVKGNVTFAAGAGMVVDYLKPAHDRLTISGMLGFDGTGVVTVRLPQDPGSGLAGRMPLAVAGSVSGIDNLPAWTVSGLPSAYTGALVVYDSTLYLDVRLKGTVMLLK